MATRITPLQTTAIAPAHGARVRQRHALVQAYGELRERELSKLEAITLALAAALRSRGVTEPTARLATEAGLTAFKVGFERWVDDPAGRKLKTHVRAAMRGLAAVVNGSAARRTP